VPRPNLTFAAPFKRDVVLMNPVTATIETVEPAATAFAFSAADALPALQLSDSDELWLARKDLLASDRFAAEFVVEMERDGVAYLRFGDDVLGRRPLPGTEFALTYRIGNGPAGNLGAEALRHIVVTSAILPKGSITGVRNPLPARGGEDAEAMEEVRQFAPQAFRKQERAVTEADWAEVAQRFPGVQKAAARFRWTGSWYTVFVTVDRVGGVTAARDERFKTALRAHLEKYRVAGYDLEITDPVYVPLDLLLLVCVKPGYFRSDVLTALRRVFGRQEHADGTRGFFHPDAFTFGQSLFLSRVYAAAMTVAGVASVEVKRFQRWGRAENNELANAAITAAPLEILRLDNDPNFPENGKIEFELHGGL
jgi:predicted phage baseplate assembly protein